MTHESVKENLEICVVNFIKLVEDQCWNTISPHLTFIISDFNEFDGENFPEIEKLRNKANSSKRPGTLEEITEVLNNEFQDLYDVNVYIFKALKKNTIIEIQYYENQIWSLIIMIK